LTLTLSQGLLSRVHSRNFLAHIVKQLQLRHAFSPRIARRVGCDTRGIFATIHDEEIALIFLSQGADFAWQGVFHFGKRVTRTG